MKNLILLFDGTLNTIEKYNSLKECTHIRRLFNLISGHSSASAVLTSKENGITTLDVITNNDRAIYIEGIASSIDALTGKGILNRVELAYNKLTQIYEPGDKLFLYGFSRGAASALCTAHYINDFGIWPSASYNMQTLKPKAWLERKTKTKENFYDIVAGEYDVHVAPCHQPYHSPIISLTLLDTVFASNECDLNKYTWLQDVTGIAKDVTHIYSKHEDRKDFTPCHLIAAELIFANKFTVANDILGAVIIENGRPYVFAPKAYKCLSELIVDGSHSDIGGSYTYSALGLPAFNHILNEFKLAHINFNYEVAVTDCKKMTDLILRKETDTSAIWGLLWRLRGRLDRKIDLRRSSQLHSARIIDPTSGDLNTEFGKYFLISYVDIKRKILNKLNQSSFEVDIFDLSDIPLKRIQYCSNHDIQLLSDMCLFSYEKTDISSNSAIRSLDPLKKVHISTNQEDIDNQAQHYLRFAAHRKKLKHAILKYKQMSEVERLATAKLYKGPSDKKDSYANLLMVSNALVLLRIQKEISATEPEKASVLLEYICKTFKMSTATLEALSQDPYLSFKTWQRNAYIPIPYTPEHDWVREMGMTKEQSEAMALLAEQLNAPSF